MPRAVKPARRAALASPAPAARPTLTVAAKPIPKGTMKVREGNGDGDLMHAAIEATPNAPIAKGGCR